MIPEIRNDVPLAPLTTLGVGGPARYFAEVRAAAELNPLAAWARERRLPTIVLGGGSNVVVHDAGLDALVVAVRLRGIAWTSNGEVTVAAGETWDDFVAAAVERGWAGVECLSGIPGSAGATPIQNVGAYGQEVAETIASVEVWSAARGAIRPLDAAACGFGYRDSAFNRELAGEIVTAVRFELRPGGAATLRYPELERRVGTEPDLGAARAAVLALRREKSMVIDSADPDSRGVGSFFKNPVVSPEQLAAIQRRTAGVQPPAFPAGNSVKVPAAWLIERAGFAKGYRPRPDSAVGLSRRHVLAIVNYGGATAAEVLALAGSIQAAVHARFDVRLEIEPRLLGS